MFRFLIHHYKLVQCYCYEPRGPPAVLEFRHRGMNSPPAESELAPRDFPTPPGAPRVDYEQRPTPAGRLLFCIDFPRLPGVLPPSYARSGRRACAIFLHPRAPDNVRVLLSACDFSRFEANDVSSTDRVFYCLSCTLYHAFFNSDRFIYHVFFQRTSACFHQSPAEQKKFHFLKCV